MAGTVIESHQVLFESEMTGIKEIRPKPAGRVKLRIRPGEFPNVFVVNGNICTRHLIADLGTHWELLEPHEINQILA